MMRVGFKIAVALVVGGLTMCARAKNNGTVGSRVPRDRSCGVGVPPPTAVASDGTDNHSKLRREELIKKIGEIRAFLENSADTNATRLVTFAAELEKEVRQKKYGLVFEEHKERIDVELEKNLPVLTEVKERFIDNGGDVNFLIEGDNLAALKLLEKTHRGRIDLIYIDPPYNTDNDDFIYNDKFVDKSDLFRHSKWMSFMSKRLPIARDLLTNDGIIFISIDDREQAHLKVLCDEVFSEENFVCQICVKMSEATGVKMTHASVRMPKVKEYVLVYSRSGVVNIIPPKVPKEKWDDEYNLFVDGINEQDVLRLKEIRDKDNRTESDILNADSIMSKMRFQGIGAVLRDKGLRNDADIRDFKYENAWRIVRTVAMSGGGKLIADKKKREKRGESFVIETKEKKLYLIKGDYSDVSSQPRIKLLFADDYLTYNPCDLWTDIKTTGLEAEGGVSFLKGKKPLKLLERIIKMASSENALILDFFAGSGTTGHAVMEVNKIDGSRRKFILCTNNENGICENKTHKRLAQMVEKEKYPARVKYFRADYVPMEERMYDRYAETLLEHIRELVELENGLDFEHDSGVAIVLTDAEAAKLAKDKKRLSACKVIYKGHNVLMDDKTAKAFEKSGAAIRPVPKYYYPELEY